MEYAINIKPKYNNRRYSKTNYADLDLNLNINNLYLSIT